MRELQISTEEEKLRKRIHLTDGELKNWLTCRHVPFECDVTGKPWLSHALLQYVIVETAVR